VRDLLGIGPLAPSLLIQARMTLARRVAELLRAGAAGIVATAIDIGTLALLVSELHWDARAANLPALLAGGVANFIGNRHFAFRAGAGNIAKQAVGYTVVEVVALLLSGALYDLVLRSVPVMAHVYWAVRLVTSHVVFLAWSFPLWRRVFAVAPDTAGV
jgi:putative flippase GtrA